jgi:hypothetical protein
MKREQRLSTSASARCKGYYPGEGTKAARTIVSSMPPDEFFSFLDQAEDHNLRVCEEQKAQTRDLPYNYI